MNQVDILTVVLEEATRAVRDLLNGRVEGVAPSLALIANEIEYYNNQQAGSNKPSLAEIYASPDVLLDFDTVVGWLSKNRPDAIESSFDVVTETIKDGMTIARICRKENVRIEAAEAPEVFKEMGIRSINQYPNYVIERHFA